MYDIVCMHVRYAYMMHAGKQAGMYVYLHTSFSKRAHQCKRNSFQRSKQKKRAERLANAELVEIMPACGVFSFAQLRAETCGNHAWEAPGKH